MFHTIVVLWKKYLRQGEALHSRAWRGIGGGLPPVSVLFTAFLGYNPIRQLVGAHTLARLPAADAAVLDGRRFFPQLIAAPFQAGLHIAFAFAIGACLVAALASWSRGRRYVDGEVVPARRPGR